MAAAKPMVLPRPASTGSYSDEHVILSRGSGRCGRHVHDWPPPLEEFSAGHERLAVSMQIAFMVAHYMSHPVEVSVTLSHRNSVTPFFDAVGGRGD